MSIDNEARNESLSYIRHESDLTFTPPNGLSEIRDKTEVNLYLDSLKPRHYAALALVIGELIDEAKKVDLSTVHSRYSDELDDSFSILQSDSIGVFRRSMRKVGVTDAYGQAKEYPRVIGALEPNRFTSLDMQLLAGWSTASSTMITTLARLPAIVGSLAPETKYPESELVSIARRSVGLSWQMARLCVNQLIAAREILDDRLPYNDLLSEDATIDTSCLDAVYRNDRIACLKFSDLGKFEIPTGFTPHDSIPPIEEVTLLEDMQCNQIRTIGCPITLLPGKLNILWNWYIDAVEKRRLWASDSLEV
jgi:hypothetical protein